MRSRHKSRGDAITGVSTFNNGVVGQTSATPTPMPSAIIAKAGVLGQDTTLSPSNAGVAGTSTHGYGVYGTSQNYGVYGASATGYGVYGTSEGDAVYGASTNNRGVTGSSSNGIGVLAQSFATPPSGFYFFHAALAVHGLGGAPLIIAENSSDKDVMSLDDSGNLRIAGNLYANSSTVGTPGNPLAVHRTATGRQIGTYAAEQTERTIEDIGEARLIIGQAYVRLDPKFAATIDSRANYLVFITPQGEPRGTLYIAQKTPAGFVVRENLGGRSTLAFDYRIVAKPLDSNAGRLPLLPAVAPGESRPAPLVQPPSMRHRLDRQGPRSAAASSF